MRHSLFATVTLGKDTTTAYTTVLLPEQPVSVFSKTALSLFVRAGAESGKGGLVGKFDDDNDEERSIIAFLPNIHALFVPENSRTQRSIFSTPLTLNFRIFFPSLLLWTRRTHLSLCSVCSQRRNQVSVDVVQGDCSERTRRRKGQHARREAITNRRWAQTRPNNPRVSFWHCHLSLRVHRHLPRPRRSKRPRRTSRCILRRRQSPDHRHRPALDARYHQHGLGYFAPCSFHAHKRPHDSLTTVEAPRP